MLKIIHFADALLDAPLTFSDPEKAKEARIGQREALDGVLAAAEREEADIVLISGGLFDRRFITRDTAYYIKNTFAKYPSLKIFIMPGEADHYSEDSVYAVFPLGDNVHVFDSDNITCVDITSKDGTKAVICGTAVFSDGPSLEKFENFKVAEDPDGDTVSILLAPKTGEVYALAELMETGADVIAFSSRGKSGGVVDDSGSLISDPGSLVPVCFDENERHGYSLITCSKERGDLIGKGEFVPFAKREYITIDIDISGISEKDVILETVRERIDSSELVNGNVIDIRLIGINDEDTAVPSEEVLGIALDAGAYDAIVSDETEPIADYESRASDHTLKGAFMAELGSDIFGDDKEKRRAAVSALRVGLDAIEDKELLEDAEA